MRKFGSFLAGYRFVDILIKSSKLVGVFIYIKGCFNELCRIFLRIFIKALYDLVKK